ncbi:MAG: glycine-rich domain-containing protein [Verrucomicrobiia bacterium]
MTFNNSANSFAGSFTGNGSGLTNAAIPNMQVFNGNGTFVVPAGVTRIMVEVWAGGGGGGSNSYCSFTWPDGSWTTSAQSGGGGGGGGYGKQVFDVVPGTSYPVIVGIGGVSNTDGGDSSFGSLITAFGGFGGSTCIYDSECSPYSVCGEGGPGGMSDAAVNIAGESGGDTETATDWAMPGNGGAAGCGGAGGKYFAVSDVSGVGHVPGGGGAGAIASRPSLLQGAHGGNGRVIVYY